MSSWFLLACRGSPNNGSPCSASCPWAATALISVTSTCWRQPLQGSQKLKKCNSIEWSSSAFGLLEEMCQPNHSWETALQHRELLTKKKKERGTRSSDRTISNNISILPYIGGEDTKERKERGPRKLTASHPAIPIYVAISTCFAKNRFLASQTLSFRAIVLNTHHCKLSCFGPKSENFIIRLPAMILHANCCWSRNDLSKCKTSGEGGKS